MGLVQFSLLRSQHKMARLLLVGLVALCVASTKAAVIPVEEIVDGLQSFLTAPEESGLRLKRSTGEWDNKHDIADHRLRHLGLMNTVKGAQIPITEEMTDFIKNWLAQHIKNTDF